MGSRVGTVPYVIFSRTSRKTVPTLTEIELMLIDAAGPESASNWLTTMHDSERRKIVLHMTP